MHPAIATWSGRGLTGLLTLALGMSGAMKLMGGPQLDEGFKHLGLPASMAFPLGILEMTCLVLYVIPPTSVIGAILLTGYFGGAICTHWRVGEAFVLQVLFGIVVWVALCLREPRLWSLMPIRSRSGPQEPSRRTAS